MNADEAEHFASGGIPYASMSANGTYETYGLSGIESAFKVKPDTGPAFAEVRV